jgi:SAM-dependent methyltransferase
VTDTADGRSDAGGPTRSDEHATADGRATGDDRATRDDRRTADALARYYDLDLADDPGDLELYLALAQRTGGPVLELAAGTGRLAIPLAASGLAVTALDHDPAMLRRAATRWRLHGGDPTGDLAGVAPRPARRGRTRRSTRGVGSLELLEADLISADLGDRFGLVILALNSLLLLETPDRQAAAVRSIARHLRADGLAVIDVWLPGPDDLALYDGRIVLEWLRDDPERGERVAKQASARFDPATAIVDLTALFDAWPADGGPVRRVGRTDRLRLVGASELVRLAEDAGLRVDTLAGDYSLTPFGTGAERAVLAGALL